MIYQPYYETNSNFIYDTDTDVDEEVKTYIDYLEGMVNPYGYDFETGFGQAYGVFSVLGHCFPIWLNFTGGKGVATGIGVMLAFNPILSFLGILIWIIIFFITKTSSISALVMYFCYPLLLYTVNADKNLTIGFLIISFTIFCKHYENILRLIKKEELKFKK